MDHTESTSTSTEYKSGNDLKKCERGRDKNKKTKQLTFGFCCRSRHQGGSRTQAEVEEGKGTETQK